MTGNLLARLLSTTECVYQASWPRLGIDLNQLAAFHNSDPHLLVVAFLPKCTGLWPPIALIHPYIISFSVLADILSSMPPTSLFIFASTCPSIHAFSQPSPAPFMVKLPFHSLSGLCFLGRKYSWKVNAEICSCSLNKTSWLRKHVVWNW
jgi:hypothetical protein